MADAQTIQTRSELLPEKTGIELQSWLQRPEANTLVRVIESKVRKHMAEVSNAALQAIGGAPLKMNLADENLKQAQRYRDFLAILTAVKDQKEPFEIVKWTS